MNLLLDTHIFLWFISGNGRLSPSLIALIRNPKHEVFLSVASIWEVTIKYQLGKMTLPAEPSSYLPVQRQRHQIQSLVIDEQTISQLSALPNLHRDPFDRILVCQALQHRLTIVTVDPAIQAYPVPTL